jgi:hypothetical protein
VGYLGWGVETIGKVAVFSRVVGGGAVGRAASALMALRRSMIPLFRLGISV